MDSGMDEEGRLKRRNLKTGPQTPVYTDFHRSVTHNCQRWQQPNGDLRLNPPKGLYTNSGILFSHKTNDVLGTNTVAMRMNFDSMLSERSPKHKVSYAAWFHLYEIPGIDHIYRNTKQVGGYQGLVEMESDGYQVRGFLLGRWQCFRDGGCGGTTSWMY